MRPWQGIGHVPGPDREVDAVGDVGVAGPTHTHDPPVLDPQVGLHHAQQGIDDDHARDDRVQLAGPGCGIVLGHAGTQVLRVAPQRLVSRLGEVLLHADPQVGVAEADPVTRGGAVATRVFFAADRRGHQRSPPP